MLYGAENFEFFGDESRPYSAGSQDHCGPMFPGVNKLCYEGGLHWPRWIVHLNEPSIRRRPRSSAGSSACCTSSRSRSSRGRRLLPQKVNHLLDDAVPYAERRLVALLADASERAWAAIVARDSAALGRALSDTMAAWAACCRHADPYLGSTTKSAQLKAFVAVRRAAHVRLPQRCGRGFLMVIDDAPVEGGMKIEINHDPIVLPHPSDHL